MISDGRFFDLPDRDQYQMAYFSLRQVVVAAPELLAFDAAVDQLDFAALDAAYA